MRGSNPRPQDYFLFVLNGYIRKCVKVLRSTNWANRVCLDAGTSHLIFIYPYSAIYPRDFNPYFISAILPTRL